MPDDHVFKTIELVQGQVRDLERQLTEKKRMVNDLCRLAGHKPIYADSQQTTSGITPSIRPDEFYGKPLATVVRSILEKRGVAGLGAATVGEIYEAMVQGGYEFMAKSDDNAKRGLYISLGKNTTTFHKLPNGTYGLLEWYPAARSAKGKEPSGNGSKSLAEDEAPEVLLEDSTAAEELALPKKPR